MMGVSLIKLLHVTYKFSVYIIYIHINSLGIDCSNLPHFGYTCRLLCKERDILNLYAICDRIIIVDTVVVMINSNIVQ